MKALWEKLIKGPWSYWTGACMLAVLNVVVLIIQQKPLGITNVINSWIKWAGDHIMGREGGYRLEDLLWSPGLYLIFGMVLGAFLSALVASQARFRPMRNRKFLWTALTGGILMGYGARIAPGCTFGGFLNGIASASLSGWIFAAALVLGAWIGGIVLKKIFL